jgi:cellobiose-specific phosphotransferase system component IIB
MTSVRHILGLTVLLLWAAAGQPVMAGDDPRCSVPDALLYADQPMPRVAKKLATGQPLRILVLGSSSSLQTAKGLPRSYAAGLPDALTNRLKPAGIEIENLSERTLTAAQMAAIIAQRAAALHPDLVIWQTGNVDAAQKIDINSFSASLHNGLEHLKSHGFDVMLVAPQYRVRLSVMVDVEPYNDVMDQIASAEEVVLFPRFEIMRHWTEADSFDLRSNDLAVQMREAEAQNRCLAEQMAGMIAAAARKAKP